jgi:SAM-dependent methyltransferase
MENLTVQNDFRRSALILALCAATLILINILLDQVEPSIWSVITGFVIFWAVPLLVWSQRERIRVLWRAVEDAGERATALVPKGFLGLFIISFVTLFVEVALIRYVGSQTRIFAFYKNIPLVGAFLGLGTGCFRSQGRTREALLFLAGMAAVMFFFTFVAQSLGGLLGTSAGFASSERLLGWGFSGIAPVLWIRIAANLHVAAFCVAVFLALAGLFHMLGRILGEQFRDLPIVPAYSVNIGGSLCGLAAFVLLSALHLSPWLWFMVGLAPLLLWLGRGMALRAGILCIALSAAFGAFTLHHTVWSAYQKLVGREISIGYLIDISDTLYQVAMDLRPEHIAELGKNPAPYYAWEFEGHPNPERVLVVGAGSGNDVAAALRAGAKHVDAVEIDSAIIQLGRDHHPEHPYADPRVNVVLDDARHAFKELPAQSYDTVVFGLLDSHTQLGTSSVRLDNYVYTIESFAAAARLVRPGGTLVVSTVSGPSVRAHFLTMLQHACGSEVEPRDFVASTMFTCTPAAGDPDPSATGRALGVPNDDWPFPYLPDHSIPASYLIVLALLVVASLVWLRRHQIGRAEVTPLNAHMFFLGAAFLLMEVYAINRLALLFGTTWLVSAISIAAMLTEVLIANLIVRVIRLDLRAVAYVALAALLIAGYAIGPEAVLGQGVGAELGYALFLLSPVLCAGVIFATSFSRVSSAGSALGANILGAVLGGWAEYGTMITGIRFMALVALALYAASLITIVIARQRSAVPA